MSPVVLEPEAQEFVRATANPPFLFDLGPEKGRKAVDEVQSSPIAKPEVKIEDRTVAGSPSGSVSVRIVRPRNLSGALPAIVYGHGAGWVFGNAHTPDRLIRELAVGSQAAVVFPNYSLSPEGKYPTAIEENYAVVKWVSEQGASSGLDARRIAVAGDSVGGNMAAALTLMAKQRRGPNVAQLPTKVRGNRARQHFITRERIQAVIDAAPDDEWRLIIALARYGGLRIPSELLALRWVDIDLRAGEMTIHASKTEHNEDGGIRACPIFPELRPYLETAKAAAENRAEFVITRYRETNSNLRSQLLRIIKRTGMQKWPKLFHNLRASRQTELLDQFPMKPVCSWLGNSEAVALENYAQVTGDHFRRAIAETTGKIQGEAASEAQAKHYAKQQASAMDRMISQAAAQPGSEQSVTRARAARCEVPREEAVTPRGIEPLLPP